MADTVLQFELVRRKYAVPLLAVEEILPSVNLLPVPGASKVMEGLLDLRGRIIPVINLSMALNLESRPINYSDHLIVLRLKEELVAIRVDRADEIFTSLEERRGVPMTGPVAAHIERHDKDLVTFVSMDSLEKMLAQYQ